MIPKNVFPIEQSRANNASIYCKNSSFSNKDIEDRLLEVFHEMFLACFCLNKFLFLYIYN